MQAMDRMRKIQVGRLYPALSPGEERLLSVVMEQEDGITVSALAERMDMPMSAVSRTMRGLENRNLILRQIMPEDRRNIIVTITPAGRASCEELHARLHAFFRETLSSFDPDEFDSLIGNWNRLMDKVELTLERQLALQKAADAAENQIITETEIKTEEAE